VSERRFLFEVFQSLAGHFSWCENFDREKLVFHRDYPSDLIPVFAPPIPAATSSGTRDLAGSIKRLIDREVSN
jgi:hypothetical protein